MNAFKNRRNIIVIFLLPALLVYLSLAVFPILQGFYISFFKWEGINGVPLEYVGFKNFIRLWNYRAFWTALKNLGWYIALSLVTQIPIGFFLALLLSSFCKGYQFFKTLFFMPLVLSATAVSYMYVFILYPNGGALNSILTIVGLESWTRSWLIDRNTAMTSIILVTAWHSVGYYTTIFFASISSVPHEILESAELDGATGLKKTWFIVVPMIWESMKISVIFLITGIMKTFEFVFLLTRGGPNGATNIPTTLMYNQAFYYDHFGRGAAIAAVIFLLSLIATLVSLKLMQREKLEY